LADY
jgi:hypothetical protein